MRVLELNSEGSDVRKWQSFLYGQGYTHVEVDGIFGPDTLKATKDFQSKNQLKADGEVGNATYAAAALKGFPIITVNFSIPPKPNFSYPSNAQREKMLGKLPYRKLGGGNIEILDGWARKNVVMVHIPQLAGIEGAPDNCKISFHRAGAEQLKALFIAWEKAGLLHYIKTWAGTFNPRMVRGSSTQVSNHAYGSAFDINAAWNGLGVAPPLACKTGTVVPLVEIANAHGFFWGGHYNSRKDGMHFELAVLNRFPKQTSSDEDVIDNLIDNIRRKPTNPAIQSATTPISAANNASITGATADQKPVDSQILKEIEKDIDKPIFLPPPPPPPPILGDKPTAAPRQWLSVEDYKPFVVRMLKRIWAAFVLLVTGYVGTIVTAATTADYSDWRVWVVIAVIGIVFLLVIAVFFTLIVLAVLYFNRKEIVGYKTEEIKSLINPQIYNFGLNFEKK